MFREQYINEKDWGKVETAIDRARRRSRTDRNNAIKQGTKYEAPAYEPIENYLPIEAAGGGGQSSLIGAGGDPALAAGMGGTVTLPDGRIMTKEYMESLPIEQAEAMLRGSSR